MKTMATITEFKNVEIDPIMVIKDLRNNYISSIKLGNIYPSIYIEGNTWFSHDNRYDITDTGRKATSKEIEIMDAFKIIEDVFNKKEK
jgi:hypothetical protein